MLVRNHTKVPLQVKLYRPDSDRSSPWADLPLLGHWFAPNPVVMSAQIGPGIEWAMRPEVSEGRYFEMRLLTEAGVVVCARRLRRGQTFDFEVPVPPRPLVLPDTMHRSSETAVGSASTRDMEVANLRKGMAASVASSCVSTRAPSFSGGSTRTSSASLMSARPQAPLLQEHMQALGECSSDEDLPLRVGHDQQSALEGEAAIHGSTTSEATPATPRQQTILEAAMCPQCLRQIAPRRTHPTKGAYSGSIGVSCDRCHRQVMMAAGGALAEQPFFHCRYCCFDSCHDCALQHLQDVWWASKRGD